VRQKYTRGAKPDKVGDFEPVGLPSGIALYGSAHPGDRPPDGATGDSQFRGALGLTPAGREYLPKPPSRPAIQLHGPAGALGELPELLGCCI
jgi:hypothetical protein